MQDLSIEEKENMLRNSIKELYRQKFQCEIELIINKDNTETEIQLHKRINDLLRGIMLLEEKLNIKSPP